MSNTVSALYHSKQGSHQIFTPGSSLLVFEGADSDYATVEFQVYHGEKQIQRRPGYPSRAFYEPKLQTANMATAAALQAGHDEEIIGKFMQQFELINKAFDKKKHGQMLSYGRFGKIYYPRYPPKRMMTISELSGLSGSHGSFNSVFTPQSLHHDKVRSFLHTEEYELLPNSSYVEYMVGVIVDKNNREYMLHLDENFDVVGASPSQGPIKEGTRVTDRLSPTHSKPATEYLCAMSATQSKHPTQHASATHSKPATQPTSAMSATHNKLATQDSSDTQDTSVRNIKWLVLNVKRQDLNRLDIRFMFQSVHTLSICSRKEKDSSEEEDEDEVTEGEKEVVDSEESEEEKIEDPIMRRFLSSKIILSVDEDHVNIAESFKADVTFIRRKIGSTYIKVQEENEESPAFKAFVYLVKVKEYAVPNRFGRFTQVSNWREEVVIQPKVPNTKNKEESLKFVKEFIRFSFALENASNQP